MAENKGLKMKTCDERIKELQVEIESTVEACELKVLELRGFIRALEGLRDAQVKTE